MKKCHSKISMLLVIKKRHNVVGNITSEGQAYEWQLKEIQVCFIH